MRTGVPDSECKSAAPRVLVRLASVIALWMVFGVLHAATIYKCVDGERHVAYRDTPCPAHTRQRRIDLRPLATIGRSAEVAAGGTRKRQAHRRRSSRGSRRMQSLRRAKPVMSWECRAADGEVFYRHTRCPGSVPGDGVVRTRYAETSSTSHSRKRRNAWSRVPVHGVKIPRGEACRRIHSAGAAVRDGHQRDAHVSTYDHLTGHDPCG